MTQDAERKALGERASFARALSQHQPNWMIDFATEQQLRQLAMGQTRLEIISSSVLDRLMMPVRAALDAGIVKLAERD